MYSIWGWLRSYTVHATYPFLPKPPFLPVYSQVFVVCQVMLTIPPIVEVPKDDGAEWDAAFQGVVRNP